MRVRANKSLATLECAGGSVRELHLLTSIVKIHIHLFFNALNFFCPLLFQEWNFRRDDRIHLGFLNLCALPEKPLVHMYYQLEIPTSRRPECLTGGRI